MVINTVLASLTAQVALLRRGQTTRQVNNRVQREGGQRLVVSVLPAVPDKAAVGVRVSNELFQRQR